jgi:hypothetical protein
MTASGQSVSAFECRLRVGSGSCPSCPDRPLSVFSRRKPSIREAQARRRVGKSDSRRNLDTCDRTPGDVERHPKGQGVYRPEGFRTNGRRFVTAPNGQTESGADLPHRCDGTNLVTSLVTKQNADPEAGVQLSLSYCFCSRILGCEGYEITPAQCWRSTLKVRIRSHSVPDHFQPLVGQSIFRIPQFPD